MKIVERLSVVNTAISFINLCPITFTILSFLAFEKTFVSVIIHSSIIVSVFVIHFVIYICYKHLKKTYYIINKNNISKYEGGKLVNYYSFYNFSKILIYRLYLDDYDFARIEFFCNGDKHTIYMNYRQAKKTIRIYLDFKKEMEDLIRK